MPHKDAHLTAVRRNQATIEYLLCDDLHLGWAVAVAFYKALHMVEALLACDPKSPQPHTDDHKSRNRLLKKTPRYAQIWRFYQPLYQASLVARYLQDDADVHDVFDSYMPRKVVEAMVMRHYLPQIQRSIESLLQDRTFFQDKAGTE